LVENNFEKIKKIVQDMVQNIFIVEVKEYDPQKGILEYEFSSLNQFM